MQVRKHERAASPDLTGQPVVIIADGELGDPAELRTYLRGNEFVIAVDGGVRHAEALGLTVDLLLGDFDSLPAAALARYRCRGTPILSFPVDKDYTDTHLALNWAAARGAREALLLGATGSRLDQTLAHLFILPRLWEEEGLYSRAVTPTNEIFPVCAGRGTVTFHGPPGGKFSLLPASDLVRGVTLEGARYPLQDRDLELGTSLTISNEFTGSPVRLSLRAGRLLVVVVRRE